jgi:hypothetical protein
VGHLHVKDVDRLSAAVAKLGAAPEPRTRHGRALTAADPQSLVEAVLTEIDETVLGRELILRNDRGEEIRLEVSGRRLLRMTAVAPKERAEAWAGTIGASVVEANGAASRAVLEVLRAMAEGSPAFGIASRKLSRRPGSAEMGCSAEALLASWRRRDLSLAPHHSPTIKEFVARIIPHSHALVRLEKDRVVQQHGAHELICKLVHLSPLGAHEGSEVPSAAGAVSLVVVCAETDEGDAILYACDDSQVLLAQIPASSLAATIAHWLGQM